MGMKPRPEIPPEKIIPVPNTKKIDFSKPFKFVYLDWWFDLLTMPAFGFTYLLVKGASWLLDLKVVGRENLKILDERGTIIVSNHCHYFDTVFIYYTLFPKKVYCTVAQRNFEVPYVRRILRILDAFPIPAGPGGFEKIVEPVGEILKRKRHVIFLPEGDLVLNSQTIHRFKTGAFRMAYIHQAPVLPFVYIIKPRRILGYKPKAEWIVSMTQVIGEPVYPPPPTKDGSFPMEEIYDMAERVASWMEETIAAYHSEGHS